MKSLVVSWMLLLYGASLNKAHYIRRIEDGDSMIYSAKEDPSGVTIVTSKLHKPTLREVLYYHIIERPYGKERPTITERSFTNSHGLQFLKESDDAASSVETGEHIDTHDDEEYRESYDEDENEEIERNHENKLEDEIQEGIEERETTESTTKPLTDKDVKEAYKVRSYLFDQMRQRYLPVKRTVSPDSSRRRKREAESETIPEAPQLSEGSKGDYIKPNTYGMNLNPEGGYVWNNLNNPPVYYELGQSPNGYPSEGQNESGQSQENHPPPTETKEPPQVTESNTSGSSENIFVNTDRQPATPSYNQEIGSTEAKEPEILPEDVKESVDTGDNPIAPIINENESTGGDNLPVEPVLNDDSSPGDYNAGVEKPVFETPENPAIVDSEEQQFEKPAEEGLDKPVGSTDNSEVDKIKDIPEAPTLPPLNYDNLPEYIRDANSSTEKMGQNESGQSQENQPPPTETEKPPQVTESNASGSTENIYVNTERQPAKPLDNQETGTTEAKEPENLPEDVIESKETNNSPIAPIINENESTERDKLPAEPVLNDDSSPNDYNAGVQKPVFESPENPAIVESEEAQFEKPAEEGIDKTEGSAENSKLDKIKDIPEAPTLPPLNYDNLPDYIRDAISSTEKSESVEHTDNPYINPQLDPEDKKTLEEKMEDIFATVQPVDDIPKTYGMNLTSDGGQVWNGMVNPPVSYNVGATDTNQKEEPKAPETSEEPKEEIEYVPKPVEEQPETEQKPENEFTNTEDNKEPEFPEITILEQPKNPEPVQENDKPSENIEEKPEEAIPETEIPAEPIEPVESETPEIPENTDDSIQEPSRPESGQVPELDGGAVETEDQPAEPKPEETDKKPDIMSELLKSEQFWKWLGEWTATYMELLEKHMRKIAIQEICNREKTGSQMCLLDGQPEDNGRIIKDGKVIIDGKEIPLTHTNNLDDLLKRGNKDDKGNKINANTIYGNSVGNEKVTNVFIFSADNTKDILEELKPGNDSKVEVIVNESKKEDKKVITNDNAEPKIEKEIPEETKDEDKKIDKSTEDTEGDWIIDDRGKEDSKEAKLKDEIEIKIPEDEVPKGSKVDIIDDEDEKYVEENPVSSKLERESPQKIPAPLNK